MSLILAAFGAMGFSRMGLVNKKHAAGGGGGSHPTYYIFGF